MIILAGDIGGTNIRLALFSSESGYSQSVHEAVYPSRNYSSLQEVLRDFSTQVEINPMAAAFVIAGPVFGDEVEITNLKWVARKSDVRAVLGDIPLGFYNDLAGISNFIPEIGTADLTILNPGKVIPEKPKAVLAPGTGLGEGFLIWEGHEYLVQSSEGGHVSFAPENELQAELLAYMRPIYGHVSYERVCSGMAIPDLYQFLKTREDWQEPEWFKRQLSDSVDKTPVIVQAALDPVNRIELCRQVLDLFVDMLAAEAGNLALKVLATGGVYLAGGVTQKVLPQLTSRFAASYSNKGRFSEFVQSIPVFVITHPQPALIGAARFAFRLAETNL